MSFDSNIGDFEKEMSERVKTTPAEVTETLTEGNRLINIDYLPKLREIKIIAPFIKDYTQMNPYERGWRIQFGSSRQWAGLCSAASKGYEGKSALKKDIYISIQFTKHDANWKKNMSGTILHEIGHAIVFEIFHYDTENAGILSTIDDLHGISKGHGLVWKAVCGAISEGECGIFYKDHELKDSFKKYKYDCFNCGHKGYGDYANFSDECSECGKPVLVGGNS